MLIRKLLPIILIIFCILNKTFGRGHGRGRSGSHGSVGHGHSSSSLSSSHSSHSSHIGTQSHSGTYRKKWSSSSSDEHKRSDTIAATTSRPSAFEAMNFKTTSYGYKFEETPAYRTPVHYTPSTISINELDNFLSGYFTGRSLGAGLSLSNHLYSEHYQPPIVIPPSLREPYKGDEDIWKTDTNSDSKSAKSNDFQALNFNLPSAQITNSLGVSCQQLRSEYGKLGSNADSINRICNPYLTVTTTPSALTTTTTTTTPAPLVTSRPYAITPMGKRYERISTTTPRGINCRKVMNSELNEKGEIIDSVWEVCDPPPTTTTTTRRPTTKPTTKRPITTAKPLVKVCRPVMDSYLNDLGEIIDSVTEVCTMEPVK
ncbi:hypothetical protein DOY81_005814 [Sarcophaga bullata]|nr:hypothetical protein DOY81_005814 [Sarcophaga bullata]